MRTLRILGYLVYSAGIILALFSIGATVYEIWKGLEGLVYKIPDNVSLQLLSLMIVSGTLMLLGALIIQKTEPKIWAK